MLYAQTSGNVVLQQNTGVRYVKGVGSDASVQLFFNNNERLKTTNDVAVVTGHLNVQGSPAEVRIQHTGNSSYSRLISD